MEELVEKYIAAFTDRARRYSSVMLPRRKSDINDAIVAAVQCTIQMFCWLPAVLLSDKAKEYL